MTRSKLMPIGPGPFALGPLALGLCALAWLLVVSGVISDAKRGPAASEELAEFARLQLDEIQNRSFAEERELCGVIYRSGSGEMERSRIFSGDESSCEFRWQETPAKIALASFHTHGAFSRRYDGEVPSIQDFETDIDEKVVGFIATPGGRMWMIDWDEEIATMICGEGCLAQDPNYRPCQAFPPNTRYSLPELKERVSQDKGEC
jgi:hypothetical protein